MDKLTKEEVLHVAMLGRLELDDNEIEEYSYKLKAILNEIEKINEVEVDTNEMMVSPATHNLMPSEDEPLEMLDIKDTLKNANQTFDNYIEVKGVFE